MNNEMWLIWKEPKTRRRYKIGTLNYNNDMNMLCSKKYLSEIITFE